MSTLLKVLKATKTKNSNYCVKLQGRVKVKGVTPFGVSIQDRQVTYYIFLEQAPPIGMEAELDLSQYNVVEKEREIDGVMMKLKQLYLK